MSIDNIGNGRMGIYKPEWLKSKHEVAIENFGSKIGDWEHGDSEYVYWE